ncbi:MAG TPA: matrixin family metalloprotease, partial [Isosphaeraceae bacterium]|nr:matrixin family metalloprotease [Isosphaeraceae bacterium]
HEFGHALGLGESQITTACMYATYNGIKQSLNTDDIAGIQSVWGAPQPDQFNSNGRNNGSFKTPANITSHINSSGQIAIPSLRITSASQAEWFSVTVPSSTTGTMVVTEQSSNLSMLSPSLWVYTPPTTSVPKPIGSVSSTAYGATVSYTVSDVQAGQTYLIREFGNSAGDPTGGFGLEVNFGSASQPPIPPPNTVVLQQPNQGGGVSDVIVQALTAPQIITIGDLSEPGDVYSINAPRSPRANTLPVQSLSAGATQAGTTDAVTPLVALATAQPGLPAGKSAVAPAAAGRARSSSPGSTPSALQAVDATILGWKVTNRLSEFTKGNTKGLSLVG